MKLAGMSCLVLVGACWTSAPPASAPVRGEPARAAIAPLHGPVTLADHRVTVDGLTYTIPDDFAAVAAHLVDLGPEVVVAVEREVVEDDLTWRILARRDGALVSLGDIFLGRAPRPDEIPRDGTIRARAYNCGQVTDFVYRIARDRIETTEHTSGTYDGSTCAACPYVLVDTGAGLRFVGESLRNVVGAAHATEDALALPAIAPGLRELVVVLSEVKPETTHLDGLALELAGRRIAPRAFAPTVFARGEQRRFVFDLPPGATGTPTLYARGYYDPFGAD